MEDPTALFHQYEQDYCNKSTDISRKISALTGVTLDVRRGKATEIEADMREADSVIKRMDMEARSLPADKARPLAGKVKEYKADLASLREQLKQAAATAGASDAARAELGLGGDYYSTSAGQRDRMLQSTERLQKTSDRLQLGKQQLAETEELGVNILGDLARQRETILHARDTLHTADDNISKARRLLSTMSKRVVANKIIMFGISAFLLLGIILIIYYRVRGS
ncbi:MAG: Qb-SNARE, VTI1-family [Monoraphidium minutum]|nr:MAG: Qb-SNARE, VTI1-family [Monoraphidium minutum]